MTERNGLLLCREPSLIAVIFFFLSSFVIFFCFVFYFIFQDDTSFIVIYYIDTSVLLENIPLVKFIKTTSRNRVVYFP